MAKGHKVITITTNTMFHTLALTVVKYLLALLNQLI